MIKICEDGTRSFLLCKEFTGIMEKLVIAAYLIIVVGAREAAVIV